MMKKLNENEKKIIKKNIRFTPEEYSEIQKKAKELKMNFSQFVIFATLNKKSSSKKIPLFKELITQIAGTSNNLNQITRICNTQKSLNAHIVSNLILAINDLQEKIQIITKELNK